MARDLKNKAKASFKAGNTETDSIPNPAADPSDSDQSFDSKLREDNSIPTDNSAGANVKDITKSAKTR